MAIYFNYADRKLYFNQKRKLKQLVRFLFDNENKQIKELNYIFCSDDYLLGINKQFLNHDTFTDIITFCLSESNESIEGEIYISLDRIKENFISFNSTFEQELIRVVVHGALHLCGYKDKKKEDIFVMRQKEAFYINLFTNQ